MSAEAAANCRMSGSPSSPDPVANWGLDTHVDVGTVDPSGQAQQTFDDVLSWMFGAIVTLVDFAFQMVAAAFSFDLFGRGEGQVTRALNDMTSQFTTPLLPLAVVLGGLAAFRHWWSAHAEHRVVKHFAVMGALMVAGLVIVADPVGLFGGLSRMAHGLGSSTLAVVSGGSARGGSGFASAEPGLWETAVVRPWCELEFGDTRWCMSRPDAQMVAARSKVLGHLTSFGGSSGGGGVAGAILPGGSVSTPKSDVAGDAAPYQLAVAEAPVIRQRLMSAQTNGALFSAFEPNWNARNGSTDDWTFYHALLADRPDLAAARSGSGIGHRVGSLVLIVGGGLLFVTLMAVIAAALFAASIGFVILLLLAPAVILLPAFETGQRWALKWAQALLLALGSIIAYSVILGVLVRVQSVILDITSSGGWLLQFGVWVLVWWMAFKHRHALLNVATAGMIHHKHIDPVKPADQAVDRVRRGVAVGVRSRRHRQLRRAYSEPRQVEHRHHWDEPPEPRPGPQRVASYRYEQPRSEPDVIEGRAEPVALPAGER